MFEMIYVILVLVLYPASKPWNIHIRDARFSLSGFRALATFRIAL